MVDAYLSSCGGVDLSERGQSQSDLPSVGQDTSAAIKLEMVRRSQYDQHRLREAQRTTVRRLRNSLLPGATQAANVAADHDCVNDAESAGRGHRWATLWAAVREVSADARQSRRPSNALRGPPRRASDALRRRSQGGHGDSVRLRGHGSIAL